MENELCHMTFFCLKNSYFTRKVGKTDIVETFRLASHEHFRVGVLNFRKMFDGLLAAHSRRKPFDPLLLQVNSLFATDGEKIVRYLAPGTVQSNTNLRPRLEEYTYLKDL